MPGGGFTSEIRFVAGLPRYFRTTQTYEAAVKVIEDRAASRSRQFLRLIKQSVFDQASSPYLPLFKAAGCTYEDVVASLRTHDLESVLRTLKDAGVWVSFDEYKGRAPIVRGAVHERTTSRSFDNRVVSRGFHVTTGGSSGAPARALVDLEFLEARATYDHLMFAMLDLQHVPLALWYPKLPASVPLVQCLRYAKIGHPPHQWFDMAIGGAFAPRRHRWALAAILAASRLSKTPLPWPRPAPIANPAAILDWLRDTVSTHGRAALQSTVSGILRVSQVALNRGQSLCGVQFLVGSEPLTAGRQRLIHSTGARVYGRYHSSDVGTVAQECGEADAAGDMHLASDTIALLQADHAPGTPAPFYVTQLMESCPRVLINVEIGDAGVVSTRSCGCLWGRLGLTTHLAGVRSYRRSTAEGLSLPYAELSRIVEDVLPARFGGTVLHYQWAEGETQDGVTRLRLRVDPGLGHLDEAIVKRAVLDALHAHSGEHGFFAQMMEKAGTIELVREAPTVSAGGKSPAVVRLDR